MNNYHELVGALFEAEELAKFEWAIGAIMSGGPQKVVVFYGPAGSGKSTVLSIIKKIFDAPGTPDVLIEHDWNPSRLTKVGPAFVATNTPMRAASTNVIIVEAKNRLPFDPNEFHRLSVGVKTEIDAISNYCVGRYIAMGPNCYNDLISNNIKENDK